MAQMPRGEPRSVPDPAGDLHNDLIRRKRLQEDHSATLGRRRSAKLATEHFSPFNRLDHLPVGRQPPEFAVVNGRLVCPTPRDRPPTSPEVLEAQRQAVRRTVALEDSPLGASASGVAMLLGASDRVQMGAFAFGALGDAAGAGRAGRRPGPSRPSPPLQREIAPLRFGQPNIRLGERNAEGQATRVAATITQPMIGAGTKVDRRITPPGWLGDGGQYNQGRGHLLANQLGGRGDDPRNLATLTQNPTNSSHMTTFENATKRRVRRGEVIEYSITPLYSDGTLAPEAVLMTAAGSRGTRMGRVVFNPAARQKR